MGHGFQYQFWTGYLRLRLAENSAAPPMAAPPGRVPLTFRIDPDWGTLDVATNGYLFIGGNDEGSSFWCIRSSNAQNPGVTPTFDQVTTVNMGGSIGLRRHSQSRRTGRANIPGGGPSGGPTNNNIYMVTSVQPTGASNGTDVMFVRSTDGGANL